MVENKLHKIILYNENATSEQPNRIHILRQEEPIRRKRDNK